VVQSTNGKMEYFLWHVEAMIKIHDISILRRGCTEKCRCLGSNDTFKFYGLSGFD
jgi:hypothetical protein